MRSSKSEKDSLLDIDNLGISSRKSWRTKVMALATTLIIILIIYLILSQSNPSLRLFNKNNEDIRSKSTPTTIGSDPFTDWVECDADESPDIIGYHVHALFDGDDQESINTAYNAYHGFITAINPSMEQCTHAHSTPAAWVTEVCYFPTTWIETDSPFPLISYSKLPIMGFISLLHIYNARYHSGGNNMQSQ